MSKLLMGFVGDLLVDRDNPREVFRDVRDVLAVPDLLFGNLECAYTDNPRPLPGAPAVVSSRAGDLDAYLDAGFDVMSLANNHILDVGHEAMLETRSRLRAHGIQTCGAGHCLSDARAPAILDVQGIRVAFLAYACVFPIGHEAGATRPGLAPMRAYNGWHEPYAGYHVPGMLPMVETVPDEADLACLTEDIHRARQQAELVITSFHWGDQTCQFHLTDHEVRTARHCIDRGAHLVIGHHHHAIRGMEWYKGKPIMYGLGHFVFDFRWEWSDQAAGQFRESQIGRHYRRIQYDAGPRRGWPLLPFPDDARMTVLAWAIAEAGGVRDIGFLPCRIHPDGSVHPYGADSREGAEIADYFKQCNETQKLNGALVPGEVDLGAHKTFTVMPA